MSEKGKAAVIKEENYHTYELNAVPWWIIFMWVSFFIFGVVYLIENML